MSVYDVSDADAAIQPTTPPPPEGGRRLADLNLDPFELGLLTVCRHFLASFETPELQAWRHAYEIAIQRWGETIGFPAAHGLSSLLQTVLHRRSAGLAFQDPLCAEARVIATDDEAALMRMLHFMRRDQTRPARECVEALLGGRRDADVIRAALSFAARFPAGVDGTQGSRAKPRLRLVT